VSGGDYETGGVNKGVIVAKRKPSSRNKVVTSKEFSQVDDLGASSKSSRYHKEIAALPTGMRIFTAEEIAHASGELTPSEYAAIANLLEQDGLITVPTLPPEPTRDGRKQPPYDFSEEERVKKYDFGLTTIQVDIDGSISMTRSDSSVITIGVPLHGRDEQELATIREAIKVLREPDATAARKCTALELLRIWSALNLAEKSWSETSFFRYSPTREVRPLAEEPMLSPVLSTGGRALFPIELLSKIAKLCGTLLERFRLQRFEESTLRGKRQQRGAPNAGKVRAVKQEFPKLWERRIARFEELANGDGASSITDACNLIAQEELSLQAEYERLKPDDLTDAIKSLGKSIARGLRTHQKERYNTCKQKFENE